MPARPAPPPIDIALLVALSFLWGGAFTLIEIALADFSPIQIVACRLSIGASILTCMMVCCRHSLPRGTACWSALLLQGMLQSALPFFLISWGQQYVDSGLASLLNTTPPIFAFLLGILLWRDKSLTARHGVGLAIGLSGIIIIMAPDIRTGQTDSILGQLAICGASLCYALAAWNAKRFAHLSPLTTAACSMTLAAIILLPFVWTAELPVMDGQTVNGWLAVSVLGVFSTAIAMVIYFRIVKSLGPLAVTSGSYLRAGFGIGLGTILLGEEITFALSIGLFLIFLAVGIITGMIRPGTIYRRRT